MAAHSNPPPSSLEDQHSTPPNTILPYLEKALEIPPLSGTVSLFSPPSSFPTNITPTTYPPLHPTSTNQLLLYPCSFNPPHVGHLATIHYLYNHRHALHIPTLFLYCDPDLIISSKSTSKSHLTPSTLLHLSLRNTIFSQTPSLNPLLSSGWLHLLVGAMESHISFLRSLTDMIRADGWAVNLVGFLGGDKLSVQSRPSEKPWELGVWGPLDEFLILNARRPVDFYIPGEGKPRNLLGCTAWERGESGDREKEVGVEWICTALTVPGNPKIRFRASESSASNGVSSTKIRKIMCEAADEELYDELKDHVIGCDMLVEWLLEQRGRRRENEGEGTS
ncbi:hypothetical protein V8E51_012002 [Hyaloscypha variabilis]